MSGKEGISNPFSFEAQFNMYALLASATLQRASELMQLNLTLSRETIRESSDVQVRLLAAADGSQYRALSALLAKGNLERGMGYVRDVVVIMTRTYPSSPSAATTSSVNAASKAA
ncbi:phasin family protein [Noviherbaspirillum sp. 1P10PC]|uniref:phasin family protein n=1 Tax=Noviherbaspirillum sp. 1P10PC TaxID=3132292 RepID=UPI00399F8E04